MNRLLALVAFAGMAALLAGPAAAVAAGPGARFGPARATPTYGEGISFTQDVNLAEVPARVELELTFPGAPGAFLIEVPSPESIGNVVLRYEYSVRADGHVLPNTRIGARWVLTFGQAAAARAETGELISVLYRDTRFQWRMRAGDVVRVHWYEGDASFGDRALAIGERAVRETAELLGVDERQPIDFYIYADEDAFREALGPGTYENVGGQANAEIRTLFALVRPSEIDQPWVGNVIPHELVHLVFNTAVDNPYHFPPKWLNEGLAVYLSQGVDRAARDAVDAAAKRGELMPLTALSGQFPTTFERFSLAYSESASAVDYLVRAHGRDALVELIRSYATGTTDDRAFERAIGMDLDAFDEAWRSALGAADPVVRGPQPAPAGPVPSGWESPAGTLPTPSASAPPPADPSTVRVVPSEPGPASDGVPLVAAGLVAAALVAFLTIRSRGGGRAS
ncbi:MAG TPA: peptidase MA family metallohydrolase [Candidatus Limnocylindrales bacterium]